MPRLHMSFVNSTTVCRHAYHELNSSEHFNITHFGNERLNSFHWFRPKTKVNYTQRNKLRTGYSTKDCRGK